MNSEENRVLITELQTKFETENKEKEIVLLNKEKNLKDIELKNNRTILIISFVGLAAISLFLVLLIFSYKQKQKINAEINLKNQKLEIAYNVVEEKNREITDSINYAKRIQNAILPPRKLVKEYIPDSFILYKPKDVVAGDFYWMEQKEDKILFAAADCTGHGVPGAMVSVICNNGLNRSVREYGLIDPGKILDKTRDVVISEFEKSEEEVKDGMDISLCALDFKNQTLCWAGANNPLWIIRNSEIVETKSDKQPIGVVDNPQPFTTHKIELQKGDVIYVFTDGFQDQFGGERGKKFKSANFKKLLLSIYSEPMGKQHEILDKTFEDWKGSLEQLDDVCVIGVRL
jgi:serine phosphatase RsbU (regulator of sigma subunit)